MICEGCLILAVRFTLRYFNTIWFHGRFTVVVSKCSINICVCSPSQKNDEYDKFRFDIYSYVSFLAISRPPLRILAKRIYSRINSQKICMYLFMKEFFRDGKCVRNCLGVHLFFGLFTVGISLKFCLNLLPSCRRLSIKLALMESIQVLTKCL